MPARSSRGSLPGNDHDLALAFDVEFPKTALQDRWLLPRARNEARANFNTWWLIAIVVAMELQASLASDQRPVVALGRPLIEVVNRCSKAFETSRPARN